MYKKFILDVDGVMTDGKLYWSEQGKPFKAFGNYDHDGLKLLRNYLDIEFISADRAGWAITESRIVNHMKFKLTYVTEKERLSWVLSQGDPSSIVFMGDGPYDAKVLKAVGIGIAPAQAWVGAINAADFITKKAGGDGAVMEACVYLLEKMGINYEL